MLDDTTAEHLGNGAAPPRTIAELPGPTGIPIPRNARQIAPRPFQRTLEDWARQYKGRYRFRVASRQFIVVSDRDMIADILRDCPVAFRRSSRTARMLEEAGSQGLLTAEGEEWRTSASWDAQRVAAAAAPLPWTTARRVSFMQQQRHFAAAK